MSLDTTGLYHYPPPDSVWLRQHTEEIIDPEQPIIDPHHHLWEHDGHPYLMDDLLDDVETGHNIVATVFVQASYGYRASGPQEMRCIGETEKVIEFVQQAKQRGIRQDLCAGMVGFVDLMTGDKVAAVIEAHMAVAGSRFKGVRHSISRDNHFPDGIVLKPAPKGLLANQKYREGLLRLTDYDLCYDAMLYHQQIPELTALAQAMPELPIILDHFGCILGVGHYRGREKETFAIWRKDMRDLADCPNVSVKIGGMGMIICGPRYHENEAPPGSLELAEAWRPYIETCIEFFGVERCMFESNFPVDKAMFSYPVLWNAYKRSVAGLSSQDKMALFHDTAKRVYRL